MIYNRAYDLHSETKRLRASLPPQIAQGGVHVWHASLDVSLVEAAHYAAVLSEDEHLRANRYVNPLHQARFTVGRGILRTILSHYENKSPEALRFVYGPHGKPDL